MKRFLNFSIIKQKKSQLGEGFEVLGPTLKQT